TGLPPASVGAALASLAVMRDEPGLGAELIRRTRLFAELLRDRGAAVDPTDSAILSLPVGDNARTVALAAAIAERGVHVTAIRPPTVPVGTARLRLSVTLAHGESDLQHAADIIAQESQRSLAS